MDFQKLFKSIGNVFKAKRYLGILPGALPSSTRHWGPTDFLNALDVSLYVNRAIEKRAEKIGEIEFLLRDAKGDEIERDPLLDLLYKPNKVFTGRQFWKLYQKYYDTIGEVYIYVERNKGFGDKSTKITGLHLIEPTRVTPKFNDQGEPTEYEVKGPNETKTYQPDQILYIHNPDPKNPLRGQSLLKTGVFAIQTETQIATYHSRILENGGKVEGVFKFKTGPLTEDQLEKIKDKYAKEYASAKKAGLPLFLGGDADYVKTGLSPEELSFLEAKKMTLEDICILTGVPKSMLASTADVKFDNADADREIFLRETIHPLLVTLTTALDEVLFPDDKTLTFVDPTPENIERKLKETESGVKNYYMTINEARERHGLDPIDGGDSVMVPFTVAPLGEESTPAGDETKHLHRKETKNHPLADPEFRELYGKVQLKRMDAREKSFKREIRKYFTEQKDRLIDQLQPNKTRVFRRKDLIDDTLNIELEVKVGKQQFMPVLTELVKQAGLDALDLGGSEYEFNLTGEIAGWIESRADIFLRSINETTLGTLKEQFAESLANAEGREALIRRIEQTYENINKARAALIARTEVHNSTQYGTMEGYRQAGLTTKVWVAVLDRSTRDSHARIDGQERPLDRPFSNGLMFPGDPNGPAEEVINCRCVI